MSERLKQYWATKQASLTSDYIGSHNPIGAGYGVLHGLSKDDLTIPDDDLGYAPGVGVSRIIRRLRRVRKESVPNKKRQSSRIFIQEPLLKLLSLAALPALGVGVGAAIGTEAYAERDIVRPATEAEEAREMARSSAHEPGRMGWGVTADAKQTSRYHGPETSRGILTGKAKQFKYRDANAGANIGLLVGTGSMVAIPAAAMILAAIRRKRTKAEQSAAENRPLWMHAIPGYSTYENAKRLGASTHFEETPKERAARKAREAMENEK